MKSPISASQSTESSFAFFRSPARRLQKVTCRWTGFSILLIWTFPRAIDSTITFFFFFSLLYLRSSMVFLICFASSADNLPLVWTSFEAVAIPLYLPLKLLPKLLCLQWRLMPYRPSWNLFHYEKNMCVYIYIFLYCIWYMDVCVCAHVFVYYININVQGHYNIS